MESKILKLKRVASLLIQFLTVASFFLDDSRQGFAEDSYYGVYDVAERPLLRDVKLTLRIIDPNLTIESSSNDNMIFRFSDGRYLKAFLIEDKVSAINALYNNYQHEKEVRDRVASIWPPNSIAEMTDISSFIAEYTNSPERCHEVSPPFAAQQDEWSRPQYRILNFFELNKGIYRRGLPTLTPSALQARVQPRSKRWNDVLGHVIELPPSMPKNFIPSGRIGDNLTRDEMFYQHASTIIQKRYQNATNTLFVNYTGHEGPVAASLAKKDIPSYWRLTVGPRVSTTFSLAESLSR